MPSSSPLELVGRKVQKLRRRLNLSQEDLADAAGLHHTFISLVERGRTNVSLGNLFRIALALKTPPGELLADVTVDKLSERTSASGDDDKQ